MYFKLNTTTKEGTKEGGDEKGCIYHDKLLSYAVGFSVNVELSVCVCDHSCENLIEDLGISL